MLGQLKEYLRFEPEGSCCLGPGVCGEVDVGK